MSVIIDFQEQNLDTIIAKTKELIALQKSLQQQGRGSGGNGQTKQYQQQEQAVASLSDRLRQFTTDNLRLAETLGSPVSAVRVLNKEFGKLPQTIQPIAQRYKELERGGLSAADSFKVLGREFGVTEKQFRALAAASDVNFTQLQRQVNAVGNELNAASREAAELTRQLQQGANVPDEEVARLARRLQDAQQAAQQLTQDFRLSDKQAAQLARGISRSADEAEKLSRAMGSAGKSGGLLQGAIAGLAGGAAFAVVDRFIDSLGELVSLTGEFIASSLEANQQLKGLENALTSVLGSADAAGAELDFVRDVVNRVGGDLRNASQQFVNLSAAANTVGIEQGVVRDVFEETSRVLAVLGTDTETSNRALIALSQIASKGTLSMEELRGQLGEALPVALGATANGLGITVEELTALVSTGQISAKEFFPAFAAGLREIEGEVPETRKAIASLRNQFFDLQATIGGALEPIQAGVAGFTSQLLEATGQDVSLQPFAESAERLRVALTENPELIQQLADGLAAIANEGVEQLTLIVDAVTALVSNEDAVEAFSDQLEDLAGVVQGIGQGVRLVIGLAEGVSSLVNRSKDIPVIGENLNEVFRSPLPILTILSNGVEALLAALNAAGNAWAALRGQAQQPVPVDGIEQGIGDGLTGALNAAQQGLANIQQAVEGGKIQAPPVEPPSIEEVVKAQEQALEVAAAARERDAAAYEAELRSQGKDLVEVEELTAQRRLEVERKSIQDRIALQRTVIAGYATGTKERSEAETELANLQGQLIQNQIEQEDLLREVQVRRLEELAAAEQRTADEVIAAIEAREQAQQAIEASLERQVDLLGMQADLAAAAANLQATSADRELSQSQDALAIRQRIDEIERETAENAELSAEQRAALDQEREALAARLGDLGVDAAATEEEIQRRIIEQQAAKFQQEQQALQRAQELERLLLDIELQRANIAAQRQIREEQIALQQLQNQERVLQRELEIARVRGDSEAARDIESQLAILDLEKQGQAEILQLAKDAAAAEQESASAQREALALAQQQQRLDLATTQESTARQLADNNLSSSPEISAAAEELLSATTARADEEQALSDRLAEQVLAQQDLIAGGQELLAQTTALADQAERFSAALSAGGAGQANVRSLRKGGAVAAGELIQVHRDELVVPTQASWVISQAASRRYAREALTTQPGIAQQYRLSPVAATPALTLSSLQPSPAVNEELLHEIRQLRKALPKAGVKVGSVYQQMSTKVQYDDRTIQDAVEKALARSLRQITLGLP